MVIVFSTRPCSAGAWLSFVLLGTVDANMFVLTRLTTWTTVGLKLYLKQNSSLADLRQLKVCGWKCQMPSCIWKKLQLFNALPACSKIAQTNIKVGKTRLLAIVELRAQEQAFKWLLVGWAMRIVEVFWSLSSLFAFFHWNIYIDIYLLPNKAGDPSKL